MANYRPTGPRGLFLPSSLYDPTLRGLKLRGVGLPLPAEVGGGGAGTPGHHEFDGDYGIFPNPLPADYHQATAYEAGQTCMFEGHCYEAMVDIPAGIGMEPAGVGDGSTEDRTLLLQRMVGWAGLSWDEPASHIFGPAAGTQTFREYAADVDAWPSYTVTTLAPSGVSQDRTFGSLRGALEQGDDDQHKPLWIRFSRLITGTGALGVHPTWGIPWYRITMNSPGPQIRGFKIIDARGVFLETHGAELRMWGYDGAPTKQDGSPNTTRHVLLPYDTTAQTLRAQFIAAYVKRVRVAPNDEDNEDGFAFQWGPYDGVWLDHCDTGGTDGAFDLTGGVSNTRVSSSWERCDPFPTRENIEVWVAGGSRKADNLCVKGTAHLWGQSSGDAANPGAIKHHAHHGYLHGVSQRGPLVHHARVDLDNQFSDSWVLPPGKTPSDVFHNTYGMDANVGAVLRARHCIGRAATVGASHPAYPGSATQLVAHKDTRYILRNGGALSTAGTCVGLNGATIAADAGTVSAPPSYGFTAEPVSTSGQQDSLMERTAGFAGNRQAWRLVA